MQTALSTWVLSCACLWSLAWMPAHATTAAAGGFPPPTHGNLVLQEKLVNPVDLANDDAAIGARFGTRLAVSTDFAVIGAWAGDSPAGVVDSGVAYVYQRIGSSWAFHSTLAAADAESDDRFGLAVAIDGDTILVGAHNKSVPGRMGAGVVYPYQWDGLAWNPQPPITFPGEGSNFAFGYALALSGDTAVITDISARFQPPNFSGAAYVYQRDATGWHLQATLGPPDNQNTQNFGWSVALSSGSVLVGAPGFSDGLLNVGGTAWIFEGSGSQWQPSAQLFYPNAGVDDLFGSSVALDGDIAVVAAELRDLDGLGNVGDVFFYQRAAGAWPVLPTGRLASIPSIPGGRHGAALALSGNGLYVGRVGGGNALGAILPYRRQGNDWLPGQPITPPDYQFGDGFGSSVAASSRFVLAGAPFDDGDTSQRADVGSAYAYARTATLTPLPAANGQLIPSTPTEVLVGTAFAFGVQADPGHQIDTVSGCQGTLDAQIYLIDPVSGDCEVSASFFNSPPEATAILAQPASLHEYESSRVTLSAIDAQDPELSYAFDCNGDGSFEIGPQADNGADCVYTAPGMYTAVARAIDLAGAQAELSVQVNVLDSVPVATLTAPGSVDEDQPFTVVVGATLPSTGETIVAIELDCDHDGLQFRVDASAATPGPLQCAGHPSGGERQLAARARDQEGEQSEVVSATLSVLAINDPPTFILQSQHQSAEDDPAINVAGFAHDIAPGPAEAIDEIDQVVSLEVLSNSNPALFQSGPDFDATGALLYQAAADANGSAVLSVRACDDGASTPPNQNCSAPQSTTIEVGAVNDAPVFTLQGDVLDGPGAVGERQRAGFVTSVQLGPPDEQSTQSVVGYTVHELSDPDNAVTDVTISPDGTLRYTLAGIAGTAHYEVILTDSGGLPGMPQSQPVAFSIDNAAGTDLELSLDNGRAAVVSGSLVSWQLLVGNAGPNAVAGAMLDSPVPAGVVDVAWTCTPVALASCPQAAGNDAISAVLDLPVNGALRYLIQGTVSAIPGTTLAYAASIAPPAGMAEIDATDNAATDSDPVLTDTVFADGFQ